MSASTLILSALIALGAVLAVRRLAKRGMCDYNDHCEGCCKGCKNCPMVDGGVSGGRK